MYNVRPNLTIGFHGCDRSVAEQLFNNPNDIKISHNPYDWLGHGMYFWENNYERAIQWAKDRKKERKDKEPFVIGAVLSLGRCCDFTSTEYLQLVNNHHLWWWLEALAQRAKDPALVP